jgi:hypothetical protein
MLQAMADALGGSITSSNAVTARRHGVAVEYRFGDRGAGSNHEAWTEVTAELPAHYPLTIRIERGRATPGNPVIDIELGTPVFDELFIVEAAPADVVRHLIDDKARTFLMAQPGLIELTTFGGLRFATPGWIADPTRAAELADFVAGLASRVRDAYAAANAAVPEPAAGSPYRPETGAAADRVQANREQEIAQIRMLDEMRYDAYRRRGALVFWGIVAVVVFGIALGVMLST